MGESSDALEAIPLSAVSKKELEGAKFVGANMDEIVDPEERAENADKAKLLRAGVNQLTERQKAVINKRFSSDGSKPKTLKEIGKESGVTPERIRQIEAATLRKLSRSSIKTSLPEYIGIDPSRKEDIEDRLRVYLSGIVNACHRGDLPRALTNLAKARVRLLPTYIKVGNDLFNLGSMIKWDSLDEVVGNPNYIFLTDEELDNSLSRYTYYPKQVREGLKRAEAEDVPIKKEVKGYESMIRRRFKTEIEKITQPKRSGGINQQPQLKIPPHLK